MSAVRFRPRRRFGSEIFALASVLTLSLAVVGLFPREAMPFVLERGAARSAPAPAEVGCAFVTLTPEQETAALAAARTSWQSERTTRDRVDLLPVELPETAPSPALDLDARPPLVLGFHARPDVRVLPPSEAAAAPVRIPAAKAEDPEPAFSREKMLEIR